LESYHGKANTRESRSTIGEQLACSNTNRKSPIANASGVGLGLTETGDTVAVFPLTPFLEDFDALKAFHDVALSTEGGSGAEAAVL
jgi:hypothetical protein